MKQSGVLMHISSLASPYGIGTVGKEAREFIDFLADSGQSFWQILPVCPTGYGDSPYQSFSSFAGNPYFIDLPLLEQDGLLQRSEYDTIEWGTQPDRVDYGRMNAFRFDVLRKASDRLLERRSTGYEEFCRKNEYWLEEYALFMALKAHHGGVSWSDWVEEYRNRNSEAVLRFAREHRAETDFWKAVQYLFFAQWEELLAYAEEKGIRIIGDMPIYVSMDSADVWAHPELFQLDEQLRPLEVSGCPPDGFSETGQMWGNPLFNWELMREDGYQWWVRRISYLCDIYHVLRIDHFRGFDSYYAIPYGSDDAKTGHWRQGPGIEFFQTIEQKIGRRDIIAEDLGFLTNSVRQLLLDTGFPGMKVLEMAFDRRDPAGEEYLPHNYIPNCVVYVGTHDNDTAIGWLNTAPPEDVELAKEYLKLSNSQRYHWEMMEALWKSAADTAIVQAQDLLGLGSEARMNTPATSSGNWQWRALPGVFTPALADELRSEMERTGRLRSV
ncbi:MAG: 4-alpha-glucanotransferase [Mogibacterium sp.]|nr:4-alpha-glucanotransferase [Mogibacterium sp.]